MNQTGRSEDRNDDAALEKLLSPLKRIEPPVAAREAFRASVAAELADAVPVRARSPWWQRSIQVPVPVALLVTLLLLISVAWALRPLQAPEPPVVQPQATLPAPGPATVSSPEAVARASSKPQLPEPEYYSRDIYVCGVGRISSVSGYTIREENHVP